MQQLQTVSKRLVNTEREATRSRIKAGIIQLIIQSAQGVKNNTHEKASRAYHKNSGTFTLKREISMYDRYAHTTREDAHVT